MTFCLGNILNIKSWGWAEPSSTQIELATYASDMSLGRWVSEEDVIISKQTLKVLLCPLRRHRGQKFWNIVIVYALFFLKPSLKC